MFYFGLVVICGIGMQFLHLTCKVPGRKDNGNKAIFFDGRKTWRKVRVGLGWVGLGWVGLGWVGLGWVGLGWVGLGWVGLGWVGLGCTSYFAQDRTVVRWIPLECITSDWAELIWAGPPSFKSGYVILRHLCLYFCFFDVSSPILRHLCLYFCFFDEVSPILGQ
jgi:hypothetical protein